MKFSDDMYFFFLFKALDFECVLLVSLVSKMRRNSYDGCPAPAVQVDFLFEYIIPLLFLTVFPSECCWFLLLLLIKAFLFVYILYGRIPHTEASYYCPTVKFRFVLQQ